MFLGYNVLSVGILTDSLPVRQAYNFLEIDGNIAGLTIDALHVQNIEVSDADILAVDSEETWGVNTILLAGFENTLEAGTLITSIPYSLTAYKIRRREVGSSLNPLLTTVTDPTQSTFADYTANNNTAFVYTVAPYFTDGVESIEGRGLSTGEEGVSLSFAGWILSSGIEATPTTSYTFTMENDSDEIKVVSDYKKYDTYNTYPTFRWGNRLYKESALKTIPYNYITLTGQYEITVALMEAIKAFINDKNVKVLRTPSGETLYVCTYDFSYKYMDKIAEQPFEIKFSFTEVSSA
jgi:hypothetical protein